MHVRVCVCVCVCVCTLYEREGHALGRCACTLWRLPCLLHYKVCAAIKSVHTHVDVFHVCVHSS